MAERTMIKVRGFGGDSNIHHVTGESDQLQLRVNEAVRAGDRLVSFEVPTKKTLSVIAKRIEAIWEDP